MKTSQPLQVSHFNTECVSVVIPTCLRAAHRKEDGEKRMNEIEMEGGVVGLEIGT